MVNLALSLVKRGYIVAAIDYRYDGFSALELSLIDLTCTLLLCRTERLNRTIYSHAMDVHNAMSYLINNQSTYNINPNQFIIGGFGIGGSAAFAASTISKAEIAPLFPNTFTSDPYYIDLDTYRPRIKGALLLSASTTNLEYVDMTDNVPFFIYHGTHNPIAPFYSGAQGCDLLVPFVYGGGAIAQRVDQFPSSYSYYLVEARGVGHTLSLDCVSNEWPKNSDSLAMLWFPDMVRFMKNSMLANNLNQFHKVITPINSSMFDYCAAAQGECNLGASNFLLDQTLSLGACYNLPSLNLTTLPLSGPNLQACSYPSIYAVPMGVCGSGGAYAKYEEEEAEVEAALPTQAATTTWEAQLFPNPAQNQLQISLHSSQDDPGTYQVRMTNAVGQLVLAQAFSGLQHNLNLTTYPNGIYWLTLSDESGNRTTHRIMKE